MHLFKHVSLLISSSSGNGALGPIFMLMSFIFSLFLLGPFHTGNIYFKSPAKFHEAKFRKFSFTKRTYSVLQNRIFKVIYFKSGLFTLEIFLQKRLLKGNFRVKISSVKGSLTFVSVSSSGLSLEYVGMHVLYTAALGISCFMQTLLAVSRVATRPFFDGTSRF